MGPLASFLVAHLTDENSDLVDSANAQRTLLWSLAQRNWDSSLLQTFGVPREVLPICTSCVGNHGTLTIGNQQVPLVVVTGDQTAALHASGEETKECAWLNLGTGAFLQRRHDTPAPSGLLTNVEVTNEAKTQWTWEATVNGAGSALAMEAAALGLTDLEDKIEDGLRTETKIPIFLNGVSGLGSPYWVANFESRYLNDDGCSPEAKLVAVLESILFAIAMNLEIMERHGGPVALVEATGGLARSRALLERLAALIDRPVRRREDSEGTARGLAYLTLRHTLGAAPEDWNTSPVTLITPLPAPNLRERYQEYKRAIRKAVEGKGSSQA